ncbi:MAG: hypothetical protein MZW92_72245 [Comamonadaceae bacterium]|nr:hypothetical protein [Comamonadaceae bacterium]
MIRGMAIAGRHLGRADFVASAERALDFIRALLWRDGRLLAVHKDGQSAVERLSGRLCLPDRRHSGTAAMPLACWRSGLRRWRWPRCCSTSSRIRDAGGFFFTAADHERLIQRPKPAHDDATAGRQRHRRAGAVETGASHRPDRLSGRGRADPALGLADDRTDAHRLQRHADGVGGVSGTGADHRAARRGGGVGGMAGPLRQTLRSRAG